jgi:predicted aspartyl protease
MTFPSPFLALLGLCGLLAACAGPAADAPPAPRAACVFGAGDALPLLEAQGSQVASTVNGRPVTLEVSTGLGLTSLQPEAARRLELPEDPRRQSSYDGAGGRATLPNVLVRELRLGGQNWGGRSLAQRPFRLPDGGAAAVEGMLAADLLKDTKLELDLAARRIAFHPARDCRPDGPSWAPAASLPMALAGHGNPVITVQVQGQPVRALVHSGNNVTTVSRALAARLGLGAAQATGRTSRSYDMDAVMWRGTEYRLAEVAAGGEVQRDLPVVVAESTASTEDLVLGQDWLARRKVWFSFATRRLYLAAPGG